MVEITALTSPPFVVIVVVTTSGAVDELLGSDESEIIQFAYLLLDVAHRKVRG